MQPQFVSGSPILEGAWAAGILLVSGLLAWLIIFVVRRLGLRIKKRLKSTLIPQILESLYRPIVILVISQGFILALDSVSYLASWQGNLGKSSVAVVIVLTTYALARSGGVLLASYLNTPTIRRRVSIDEGLVRLLRRVVALVIYAIGVIILLDYLNISITPIIAGLGIGGLAIALALQPTLGNFFAGTQIVSDRVVRIGDFIELDNSSIKGYVVDVGWRSTRVCTPYNNMVTIPNSRLADSIITNFYGPTMELGVVVKAGVSYSSNLTHVENVALEVARELIEELDEAVKTFEPGFGYEEFGESNINFWVWLQAKDRIASFRVKSELIKRLKTRFDREGIIINYPVRTYMHLPEGTPPGFFPGTSNTGDSEKHHERPEDRG